MNIAEQIEARGFQIALAIEFGDVPPSTPVVVLSENAEQAAAALFVNLHRILSIDIPAEGAIDPDAEKGADPVKLSAASLERNRAVMVLHALGTFIGRAWCDSRRTAAQSYLLRWALVLDQLNDGTRNPLVEPTKSGRGMTVTRIDKWKVRADACAAFYCLERDGRDMSGHDESRRKIAAEIARAAPDLKRAMQGTAQNVKGRDRSERIELGDAIISWRKRFMQGEAPEIAQGNWEHGCRLADEMSGGDPAGYARHAQACMLVATRSAAQLIE